MRKQARITAKGQITVPRDSRRALGVHTGDSLVFESDGNRVQVRPLRVKSPFENYRGFGNPGIPPGPEKHHALASRVAREIMTAVDTNIAVAMWDEDPNLSFAAQLALDRAG
ncbi:MAG TPA: AbrB/MazE/SpoVT family DNA-binding domain-containing protein [Terriglobia bacterium]|nr:AbrB/MazE/SpoVT family DNA-binding domain-containing protein [Terriglobia bacterium]